MARLRVRKLYFQGFQQFQDLVLDLTGPDGEPLDRICLIGSNGTGKSTILRVLSRVLRSFAPNELLPGVGIQFANGERDLLVTRSKNDVSCALTVPSRSDNSAIVAAGTFAEPNASRPTVDLVVYCPPEVQSNVALGVTDVPDTTLERALSGLHSHHEVSSESVQEMWRTLLYLVNQRGHDRQRFELANQDKTKRQLLAEFDASHPAPLESLGALWNRILARAGLEFDADGVELPTQLSDNLKAYVRTRDTRARVPYNQLSTGIRNHLFRLGHLHLLYLARSVRSGFLLVDEPENSLFPDFLFDLMEAYAKVVQNADGTTNTQSFFATHSPLVAAQFEPHERIVLEWDSPGSVTARRGVAPKGDDPNDLLSKDFGLAHVMGPEGRRQWDHYQRLRQRLRRSQDEAEKLELVTEAAAIAGRYGFEPSKAT